MSKIKFFIQQSWLLIVASCCFGLLLAVANAAWSPLIEQNKVDKISKLMANIIPAAHYFEQIETLSVKTSKGKPFDSTLYKAVSDTDKTIGYCFNASGSGFADKIELVVGVDAAFEKIAGFDVLFSNETPGFGDKIKSEYYQGQFIDVPAGKLTLLKSGDPLKIDSDIIAISGATVSSDAVTKTVNNILGQMKTQMQQKGLMQ